MGYRGFYVKNVALLFCERIDKILKKSFATVTILVRESYSIQDLYSICIYI